MGKTTISWTEHTWNPTRGCSRVSEGCRNCYAERMAARGLPGLKSPATGEPFAIMTASGPRWTGKVELIESMLDIPLRRKKPTTYFVNSMSDLFHESLPDESIDRVFAVMALCPQHTFQVLTKRAERMRDYWGNPERAALIRDVLNDWADIGKITQQQCIAACAAISGGPLPKVWLGVSVEDQPTADARIPHLLRTPAAVRFVSYEPALGRVNFEPFICPDHRDHTPSQLTKLDWVIVGGESGPGARPFDIAWARQTIAQCKADGVACFVKQIGARPYIGHSLHKQIHHRTGDGNLYLKLKDRKGGDMAEWPEDLRVREMPRPRGGLVPATVRCVQQVEI